MSSPRLGRDGPGHHDSGGTPRRQARARQVQPTTWQERRCDVHTLNRQVPGHDLPGGQRVRRGHQPRPRIKRRGRTKAAVTDKLKEAVKALESGIDASNSCTVAEAVNDWLAKGLKDRDDDTIATNRILAEQHVIPLIGVIKLQELRADQIDEWLEGLTGKLATRSLQGVHAILKRSIRQAQARDKVLRNVAELATTPKGKEGHPSRAMTLEQATAMLEQAKKSRLHAYVVVSLLTGIRTEEARALRWSHVVAWVEKEKQWRARGRSRIRSRAVRDRRLALGACQR